jgi:hypothetical protein
MFRLVVDLTTRPLLPPEGGDAPGLTSKVRRDLGLRLPWLFDNGLLPRERTTTTAPTPAPSRGKTPWTSKISPSPLLERVFTERERLKLAEVKRAQRSSYAKASRFSPGISSIISSSSQRRSTFVRSLSARSASACTWPMPFAHDLGRLRCSACSTAPARRMPTAEWRKRLATRSQSSSFRAATHARAG